MKVTKQTVTVKDAVRAIVELSPEVKSSAIADAISASGTEVTEWQVRGIRSSITKGK